MGICASLRAPRGTRTRARPGGQRAGARTAEAPRIAGGRLELEFTPPLGRQTGNEHRAARATKTRAGATQGSQMGEKQCRLVLPETLSSEAQNAQNCKCTEHSSSPHPVRSALQLAGRKAPRPAAPLKTINGAPWLRRANCGCTALTQQTAVGSRRSGPPAPTQQIGERTRSRKHWFS